MIIRNTTISPKAAEVRLIVAYSRADVTRIFKKYTTFWTHNWDGELDSDLVRITKKTPWTEAEFREFAETQPGIFANFDGKWRRQLSGWLWNHAVDIGYFVESATVPGEYYLTSKALKLAGVE